MSAIIQDAGRYGSVIEQPLPYSRLGMASLLLALVIAVGVLFDLGLVLYLARDLPSALWHQLTALNVDVWLSPKQNKHLGEITYIWRESLCHILLPAQMMAFLLGASSLVTSGRSKRPGLLAMLVSVTMIILAVLVLHFRFSLALVIPGLP